MVVTQMHLPMRQYTILCHTDAIAYALIHDAYYTDALAYALIHDACHTEAYVCSCSPVGQRYRT